MIRSGMGDGIRLRPVSSAALEALAAGRPPDDVRVAEDYPTEFSYELGRGGAASPLGLFFLHRVADDVVVGEIGGGFIGGGDVMIGYAIVDSCWGRGYATAAVRALVEHARTFAEARRIVAHTPLDRPASGRVLEKAGFSFVGEQDDEHDGVPLRVCRWQLAF
jgi:ribosomal-protein-alanine N-acetyltransferase